MLFLLPIYTCTLTWNFIAEVVTIMSAASLDDPARIHQFTQIYLQYKPAHAQTKNAAGDETKDKDGKTIDSSSDLPNEDQGQSFEDPDEPSVSFDQGHTESHDHEDHLSHHTSERSVCGDQQSDRTALSDHADNMSYQSSVESVLPDQRSDRTALSDQIDGQSVRSDEQSDHEDSQSNHNFQQFTHPTEQRDQADEQFDHADTMSSHTYQSTHASGRSDHASPPYYKDLDSDISSRIRHQATQTEPVNIYSPHITKMSHSKTKAESLNSSATSSPSTTLSKAVASQSSDLKGKPAIDSVLLKSPKLSGILPPPSTPEAQPDLNATGISKLIISELESRRPLSMGESRHAPRTSGSYGRFQPFRVKSKSKESVPGKGSDLESGSSEIQSPLTQTVAVDDDNSKLSGLPDSEEDSRWDTPSSSKPSSGATATSTLTQDAIDDDERSNNGNSVDNDSVKDTFADDEPIDEKFDDGKYVDNESINKESVNGNSKESKSDGNEFIDSNLFGESSVNHKSAHGESANSKSIGDGAVRKGTHLPPHLRHLENSAQGPYKDHISEGKLTDQSNTAEVIQQHQIDAGTTNGRSGKRPTIQISTANPPRLYADGTVGSDLTPSSVIFHAVSPPPNARLEDEDRTELAFFGQWGKPEARTTPGMFLRLLLLKDDKADFLQPPKSAK